MSEMQMILAELNRLRERVAHLETRQEHPGYAASDVARLSVANTFAGDQTIPNTGLHLLDTNASHDLIIAPGSNLTADRTLTVTTGDANRTLTLTGNATANQDVSTAGSPEFAAVNVGAATDTTITRVSAGVIAVEGLTVTLNTATQHLTNKTMGGTAFLLATNTGAGTATLALATSAHAFLFIHSSSANRSALYHVNSTATILIAGDTGRFKTTIDAGPAGTSLNAYYSGGSIYIQSNRTDGGHAGTYMLIYF